MHTLFGKSLKFLHRADIFSVSHIMFVIQNIYPVDIFRLHLFIPEKNSFLKSKDERKNETNDSKSNVSVVSGDRIENIQTVNVSHRLSKKTKRVSINFSSLTCFFFVENIGEQFFYMFCMYLCHKRRELEVF